MICWQRVDAGAAARRVPQGVDGLLERVRLRLPAAGRPAAAGRERVFEPAAAGRERGFEAAGRRPRRRARRGRRWRRDALLQLAAPLIELRARLGRRRALRGEGVRSIGHGRGHGLLPERGRRRDEARRRRKLLLELGIGLDAPVRLGPLVRAAVGFVLGELIHVRIALLLARRGRRARVGDVRGLLVDLGAALGRPLREALGSGLRHLAQQLDGLLLLPRSFSTAIEASTRPQRANAQSRAAPLSNAGAPSNRCGQIVF